MSTTLGVIPTIIKSNLTFGNVVMLAEKTITEYFLSVGMKIDIHIKAQISDTDERYIKDVQPADKFIWEPDEFALFNINNIKSGTEAYCERLSDTLDYWENYITDVCGNTLTPQQISQVKTNNIKWYFKRASGKSALVNLAYGHLAAATAALTDGILHSKMGWDPVVFPTRAPAFLETYFKPEKTDHTVSKKWSEKSLHEFRMSLPGKKAVTDFQLTKLA